MTQRRSRGDDAAGAKPVPPSGGSAGPRRPANPAALTPTRPSAGAARPGSSLVIESKESTPYLADLHLRHDDIGRGFLYEPIHANPVRPPDPRTGPRYTHRLSRRAVRQIKGAAIKADQLGIKLSTFITFTVRAEERPAFLDGELVLGKEVKRTLNGLNEWLRRRGHPILVYIWVAENLRDENPHVHMLTSYRVRKSEFRAFAAHLESLWGFGFARIERIRKPKRAGGYLMKSLSYALKGAEDDQGTVFGNRYGISRRILPAYETIPLHDCSDAASGLRQRVREMTDEIEEYADGVWVTPHGLAFGAGTTPDRFEQVLEQLAARPST